MDCVPCSASKGRPRQRNKSYAVKGINWRNTGMVWASLTSAIVPRAASPSDRLSNAC